MICDWRSDPENLTLLDQCVAKLSGLCIANKRFGDVRASKILFFAVPDAPFYILDRKLAWPAWKKMRAACPEIRTNPVTQTYAAWRTFCAQVLAHQAPLSDNYVAKFSFPNAAAALPHWNDARADWLLRRIVDFMLIEIGGN